MSYHPNDDTLGNRFEIYGSEGWPDLQDDPWEGIPEQDRQEADRD